LHGFLLAGWLVSGGRVSLGKEERSVMEGSVPDGYGLSRRRFLAASALAGAGALLAGCGVRREEGPAEGAGYGNYPETPEYNFVFVNHVTTNPFFTPTRYGIEDAQALVGTTSQWTGSETSNVREMVDAMNTAISGNADGIAVSIVDPDAFNGPIERALEQDIPVVAYNANGEGPGTNPALAYIGQDLFLSGVEMGKRIVELVQEGPVVLFIATPGQLNIQPRIDGAIQAIEDSGAPIEYEQIATGAELPEELSRVESYYQGHQDVRGMFAVDAGSTQAVAQIMEKYDLHAQGVRGGGYDLLPETLRLLNEGHIDFTIDQQPYLQGFYPVLQLFLYKISGGLTGPAETNTGLLFVEQEDAALYLETESRFEGDSEEQKILDPEAQG
jgi:simple sugar transport system substrate-binding protein